MVRRNGYNFNEITYCGSLIVAVLSCIQHASGENIIRNLDYSEIANLVTWKGSKAASNDHQSHKPFRPVISDEYIEEDAGEEILKHDNCENKKIKTGDIGVGPLKFVQDSDIDYANVPRTPQKYSSSFRGMNPPYLKNFFYNYNGRSSQNFSPLTEARSKDEDNLKHSYRSKPNEVYSDKIHNIILKNQQASEENNAQLPASTSKGNVFYRYLPEVTVKESMQESTSNPLTEQLFNELQMNKEKKFDNQKSPKVEKCDESWEIKKYFKSKCDSPSTRNRVQNGKNIMSFSEDIRPQFETFNRGNTRLQNENLKSFKDFESDTLNLNTDNIILKNENIKDFVRSRPENLNPPHNENAQSYEKPMFDNLKMLQNENIHNFVKIKLNNAKLPQNEDIESYVKLRNLKVSPNEEEVKYVIPKHENLRMLENENIQSYRKYQPENTIQGINNLSPYAQDNTNSKFNNYQTNGKVQNTNINSPILSNEDIVKTALKLTDYDKIEDKCNKVQKLVPNRELETLDTSHYSLEGNKLSELAQNNDNLKDIIIRKKSDNHVDNSEQYGKEENIYDKSLNLPSYRDMLNSEQQLKVNWSQSSYDNIDNSQVINKYAEKSELIPSVSLDQKTFHNDFHISPPQEEENFRIGRLSGDDLKRRATTKLHDFNELSNKQLDPNDNPTDKYNDIPAILFNKNSRAERSNNNNNLEIATSGLIIKNITKQLGLHELEGDINSSINKKMKLATDSIFAVPTPMSLLPAEYVFTETTKSPNCSASDLRTHSSVIESLKSEQNDADKKENTLLDRLRNSLKGTTISNSNELLAEAIVELDKDTDPKDVRDNKVVDSIETVITQNPLIRLKTPSDDSLNEIHSNNKLISSIKNKNYTTNVQKSDNPKRIQNLSPHDQDVATLHNSTDINKKLVQKTNGFSKSKSASLSNNKKVTNKDSSVKSEDNKQTKVRNGSELKNNLIETKQDEDIKEEKPFSQWMDIDYDDRNRRGVNCGCFPTNEDENEKNLANEETNEESGESYYALMNKNHPQSLISRTFQNWMADREHRQLPGKNEEYKTKDSSKSDIDRSWPEINDIYKNKPQYNGYKEIDYVGNNHNEEAHLRPIKLDDPELDFVRHQGKLSISNDQFNREGGGFHYEEDEGDEGVPLVTHTPIKHVKWHNVSSGAGTGLTNNRPNM